MEFNFNELTSLKRVITRGSSVAPLSRNTDKEGNTTFKINDEYQGKMGLEANSLETMVHPKDKKQIFIVVCPGNTGQLLKAKEGNKAKGNAFKHNELSATLDAAGYKGEKGFNLSSVGTNAGKEYFLIQEIHQAEAPAPAVAATSEAPVITKPVVKK